MEIFKDIPGYEGLYQASDLGRVKSFSKGKPFIMKLYTNRKGYLEVHLKKGIRKKHKVHRLVMLTFESKSNLQVNHIDGIKTNNKLENLEYCTDLENKAHAKKLRLYKKNKKSC